MADKHVCILMSTFNGSLYIDEQLASFQKQEHTDWSVVLRDDGSTDSSCDVIENFARANPDRDIHLEAGLRLGSAAASFLTLLARGDWPAEAHVALSDQDDIWMPHRLKRALAQLPPSGGPAIYASCTILADSEGRPKRVSRRHPRPPAFANALVQNILAGNTIVLNSAAAALAQRTALAALEQRVPHHDWWLYQLMAGAGATICIDDQPGLYYRQHSHNVLGANRGLRKAANRFAMVWNRSYADWIDCNLAALRAVTPELCPENRDLVARLADWRAGGADRGDLSQLGVWRQTRAGDLLLAFAARLGRL